MARKAVAYARYSTDMQREESIEAQIKHIKEYARENDIIIIREYIDRGASGKLAKDRKSFLQMIEDSKYGEFELVLAHKSNRFARNREESAIYKHKLKKNSVKVVFVSQDFGEGPHAVLMEAIMEGLDEFYSLDLSLEVMKGMLVNAEKCRFNGGYVLYGYKVNEDKMYEINPEEAVIVKEIYDKIIKGYSYSQIIADLHERGIRNRRGKKFTKSTIYEILRNEKYSGVYVFNKRAKASPDGKRSNRLFKSEDEIIKIPGGMPQIVPRDKWLKVQEILDKKKKGRGKSIPKKNNYLLTGFIYCGVCGDRYSGNGITTRGKKYGYYTCYNRKNKFGCNNRHVPQDEIEERVLHQIRKMLESIDVSDLTASLKRYFEEYNKHLVDKETAIKKEIKSLNKKINNLLNIVEEGYATETIKTRLHEHAETKKTLENQLQSIRDEVPTITEDRVRKVVDAISLDNKNFKEKRNVLEKLNLKIIVYPDKEEHYYGGEAVLDKSGAGDATQPLSKIFYKLIVSMN